MPRYLVLFVDTKANVAPPMAVPFYLDFLLHEEPDKLHPETKVSLLADLMMLRVLTCYAYTLDSTRYRLLSRLYLG